MSSVSSIASYATALSQAQLKSDVSTAVAKKSLDAAKQQGAAAISLLQQAADLQDAMVQSASLQPHLGQNINVLA